MSGNGGKPAAVNTLAGKGLALPAVAQKPTITLTPFTFVFLPAADACGFDVLVTPQTGRPNKERMILIQ
jgi:hypothetical protein